MNIAGCYDATSQQVQDWRHHNSLSDLAQPEVLRIELTLKEVDAALIAAAVELTVRRHESLRTCFRRTEGEIKQCVTPYDEAIFSPVCRDLSDVRDNKITIGEIIGTFSSSLKKIDIPPLFRCCIIRVSADTCYVCLLIHHIIADVWSVSLLYKELVQCYNFLHHKEGTAPGPLTMQLKDYALWQKKWLKENGETIRAYWKHKLKDVGGNAGIEKLNALLQGPQMVGSAESNGVQPLMNREELLLMLDNGEASSYAYCIGLSLYERLCRLALCFKTSIWAILSASLQILFFLSSGRRRMLIAMPVTNRYLPGTEALIGNLMGEIYLFRQVNEDDPIRDFVRDGYIDFHESVRNTIYDHDEMKLDGLGLRLTCDLFLNMLSKDVVNNKSLHEVENKQHRPLGIGPAYYGLACILFEHHDGLLCNWDYHLSLYPPGSIERMAEKHEEILEAICDHPEMTIRQLIRSLDR